MDKRERAACLQILREGDTPRPAGVAAPRNQPKGSSINQRAQPHELNQPTCAAEMVAASPVECPQGFPGRLWSTIASSWSPDGAAFDAKLETTDQELPVPARAGLAAVDCESDRVRGHHVQPAAPRAPASLDEGLLPLTLSNPLYMENPCSYKKCR